jgi:hypothetical protein
LVPCSSAKQVWLSYEEQTEEEELLDEGVAFAMLDAEGQKAFKVSGSHWAHVSPPLPLPNGD